MTTTAKAMTTSTNDNEKNELTPTNPNITTDSHTDDTEENRKNAYL
jgi:hypothetical protein